MKPLLEIKNLHVSFKVYEGALNVLTDVNMVVKEGENIGLIGEAGCGKTTTMKAVMRILPIPPARVTRGKILLKEEDLLGVNLRKVKGVRGKGISMIFQDPTAALNNVFTIGHQLMDVIRYADGLRKALSKGEIRDLALEALKDVSLPDPERILKNYPVQLSGGMRQRACIAMALIATRDLLIADEPGTSLDVTIQDQILRLLKELMEKRGTSIILISHALGTVRGLTDRVYVMYAGAMVEVAKTADIFSNPLHPYTQGLLSAIPKLTGGGIAQGIGGRIPDYLHPPEGCRFHPRCNHATPLCKKEKPSFFSVSEGHEVACFLYGR